MALSLHTELQTEIFRNVETQLMYQTGPFYR